MRAPFPRWRVLSRGEAWQFHQVEWCVSIVNWSDEFSSGVVLYHRQVEWCGSVVNWSDEFYQVEWCVTIVKWSGVAPSSTGVMNFI